MNDYLQILLGVGVLLAGGAYLWGTWKRGANSSKLDAITLLEKNISALTGKVNEQDKVISDLTKEVTLLKEEIHKKDEKLTELLALLQGRDPGMQKMIAALNEYIALGKPVMAYVTNEVTPTLKRLEQYLDKQTF